MARSDETGPKDDSAAGISAAPRRDGPSIYDYQLKEKIGEGSFGRVWKAERDGIFVALKELNKSLDSKETQDELKSLEALKKLHHKALLKTENSWTEAGRLYIEMELAEGGSLKDRLKAYKAKGKLGIPEDELLKFFTETAQAIDYLHRQTPVMLHRDIKPGNILLVKGCAKIADFGLLRQVTGDKSATRTQGGTLLYLAPESIANDMASVHTDLWSFAVTYVELRQGKLPFTGKSIGQIYDRIRWEPPELSDIFDPEEKKVILKALDKEPKSRHTSCYDFVFQLNRVVPWTPALEIPVMELAPDPDALVPISNPGTTARMTAKNNSEPTGPALEAPQSLGNGTPTPARDLQLDATERSPGRARTLHKPDGSAKDTLHVPPSVEAAQAAPVVINKPDSAPSARRRLRAPLVGAVFLGTLAFAGAAAIWFLASASAEQQIRADIDKGNFAVAVKSIAATPALLMLPTEKLRDEVKAKWWKKLEEPKDPGIEVLSKFPKELDDFKEQFPAHAGIEKLREDRLAALRLAVEAKVIEQVSDGNTYLAQSLLDEHRSRLDSRVAESLERKIKDKDQATSVLKNARVKLKDKDFDAGRDALLKAAAPFDAKDDAERNKLLEEAKTEIRLRDARDQKLVKELLDLSADPKKLSQTKNKLDEVRRIRKAYAKTDWNPSNEDLDRYYDPSNGVSVLLAAAWGALEIGDINLCREKIGTVKEQLEHLVRLPNQKGSGNFANYTRERVLLEASADLSEAAPDARGAAFKVLMDQLRGQANQPRLWKFLVQFDAKENKGFRFQEIDELEAAFGGLSPAEAGAIRDPNSRLLTQVLERTKAKIRNDGLFPTPDERAKYLTWFPRIEPPLSDYLKALRVECMLESGMDATTIASIDLPAGSDWYSRYVAALAEQKKAPAKAAARLLEALKEKPRLDSQRASSAVALLRGAVKSARGETKDWPDKDSARRAIPWLETLLKLADGHAAADAKDVDDLIDLAFAAAKADDASILEQAGKRLANARYDVAAKQKGHLGLARAYDKKKGRSDESVVTHLEAALALKAPGKDLLRGEIDKEVKGCAEHLKRMASLDPAESIKLNSLCEGLMLKWRAAGLGDNLEEAADLYADAVYNRAFELAKRQFKTTPSLRAEIYRVHEEALKGQQVADGFFLPLMDKKLNFADAKADLDEVIPEGEEAVKIGEKYAAQRKAKAAWWELKTCVALVELGRAKERRIDIAVGEQKLQDANDYRFRFLALTEHYKKAVELKRYPDAWFLSYKLGAAYSNCVANAPAKEAAEFATKATTELMRAQEALKGIQKQRALQKRERDALEDIPIRLQKLENLSGN